MSHIYKFGLLLFLQLLHYFKKVRVELSDKREVFFDENGDPPAAYDVVNWQKNQEGTMVQVKVGNYDSVASSGKSFSINSSSVWWPNGRQEVNSYNICC